MPIFQLSDDLLFPPIHLAEDDGLLAIGGDLSPNRLLLAYSQGIFPWFSEGDPILWWAPHPRFVLYPASLKVSKSMRQVMRRDTFRVSYDKAFREVIHACSRIPREGQDGTWITEEMLAAYCELHRLGHAHSVEVWQGDQLVGGLYGISIGRCFFGESMFTHVSNASKAGFITLVRKLASLQFELIDCQMHSQHLESLGAQHISRELFQSTLSKSLQSDSIIGNWGSIFSI